MGLDYSYNKIEGKIRISPSSFFMLFDNPAKWYKQTIGISKVTSNTNMVLGTLIHNRIERFFLSLGIDYQEEADYIDKFNSNVDVDAWEISAMLEPTWQVILDYFSTLDELPVENERQLTYEPIDSIAYISGTFDYRYKNTIGDYKTSNSKQSGIKTHHKLQLLVYAYLLRREGIEIENIEVTYIVKPKQLKTKYNPAIVQTYRENIVQEDMDFIINQLKNLTKRLDMCQKDSSLIELFFYTNPLAHF
jgi:hypothetical protein